jgi:Lon protease-like protein
MGIRAGNCLYEGIEDLPSVVPIFPLSGALLLPNGQIPLNIFEPRYIAMIDHAMAGERLIGMVQPRLDCSATGPVDDLCAIGCLGRVTQYAETGDDRYIITLSGVSRYRIVDEVATNCGFRKCRISVDDFTDDLDPRCGNDEIDREKLICAFRNYLDANGMEADWESVHQASNCGLLTALAMMSPWGPAEKQALLEAPNQKSRAETLIAMTEFALAGDAATLQ